MALGPRLVTALLTALTAYCLLSTILGPAGLVAYGQLHERSLAMKQNLESLSLINVELRNRLEALKSDASTAVLEARALGYIRSGETEIVLPGGDSSTSAPLEIGRVLSLLPPRALPDATIKAVAFFIGLAAFVLGLPGRRRKVRRRSFEPGS